MLMRALSQAACGLAFLIAGAGAASAGSFAVAPVRVTLSANQMVGSLTVRNNDAAPVVVQLQAMKWSQQDGSEVYAATKEVLATPPIFTIPPGGSQVIRVGLRGAPDPDRERTYRLFLREVPPPPKPGFQGLQVALHMSVPVFVKPPVAVAPVLQWKAARAPQGQLKVSLTNSGNAHVQVANFKLGLAGAELGAKQVAAYLLPGQSRDWLVKASARSGAKLQIRAQTDAGDSQADVVVN